MSPAAPDPRLIFEFQEFERELIAIEGLARDFVAAESAEVLQALRGSLRNIRAGGVRSQKWQIPQEQPLKTVPTTGYEPGKSGAHPVFASLTGVWEIAPLAERRRTQAPSRFGLVGNASVHVQLLHEQSAVEPISSWKMEIATQDSPGCYFHTHVELGSGGPFPAWLPVPRFPSYFVTPATALEFTLGELFQDDWPETVSQDNKYTQQLHPIQRRRLLRQLDAEHDALKGMGAPWLVLKRLQPTEAEMFVG